MQSVAMWRNWRFQQISFEYLCEIEAFSCHLPENDVDKHSTEIADLRPGHVWEELNTVEAAYYNHG